MYKYLFYSITCLSFVLTTLDCVAQSVQWSGCGGDDRGTGIIFQGRVWSSRFFHSFYIRSEAHTFLFIKSSLFLLVTYETKQLASSEIKNAWNYISTGRILSFLLHRTVPNSSQMYMRKVSTTITHSMEQSPSWEANWFSASQEIPRILWNARVHYRSHKRPPTVPILSQLDPVHTLTSHFLKIHLNIILPSTPGSPKWSH